MPNRIRSKVKRVKLLGQHLKAQDFAVRPRSDTYEIAVRNGYITLAKRGPNRRCNSVQSKRSQTSAGL